jgi:lipopolysaccharide biosynthesis glycosyltransferase
MWIDADTIIKCDVVPMVRHALNTNNYTVAAVGIPGKPISLSKYAQQLYPGITQTFNAGVFIVDLERWRQRGLTEEARKISLLSKKKKLYRLGSQPPLTLVIGNVFEHLNPAWNVKVPLVKEYFKEHGDSADVCLLHWVGGTKPWSSKQNLRSTHKEWWYKYQDNTPITKTSLKAVK